MSFKHRAEKVLSCATDLPATNLFDLGENINTVNC